MKYGYRMPSVKKSVSANTKGRINKKINNTINPLYGKKGMGYINDPEKAVYSKIYNKTTENLINDEAKDNIIVGFVIFFSIIGLWIFVNLVI